MWFQTKHIIINLLVLCITMIITITNVFGLFLGFLKIFPLINLAHLVFQVFLQRS